MRLILLKSIIFVVGAAQLSCGPSTPSGIKSSDISDDFRINDLLDQQIQLLVDSGYSVEKVVQLNGQNESKKVGPFDSTAWARELSFFRRIDISDPSIYSKYDISTKPLKATLIEGNTHILKSISVATDEKKGIKFIEAHLSDDPVLFKTGKVLSMELSQVDDSIFIVTNYAISGFQKMATKDSVTYSISARVIRAKK